MRVDGTWDENLDNRRHSGEQQVAEATQQATEANQRATQADQHATESEQRASELNRVLDETAACYQDLQQEHAALCDELAWYKRWTFGRRRERFAEDKGQGQCLHGLGILRIHCQFNKLSSLFPMQC